jgi:hypothetical protein
MIQKDFKQKYFLYCKDCKIDNISPQIVAQVKNNAYIRQIKITEA